MKEGAQAIREFVIAWHPVWDPGRLDLAFRAYQSLGHRRLGDEKRSGHLVGCQPPEQAQGQSHLRLRGECWMAAGEHQTKPVVQHRTHLLDHGIVVFRRQQRQLAEQVASARLAAQTVDRAVASGCRGPTARVGR